MIGFREFSSQLLEIVYSLRSFGEAPAGSWAERKVAERVRELIEQLVGVRARLTPVQVAEWRDEGSWIEGCGMRVQALALPQTLPMEAELRVAHVGGADNLELLNRVEGAVLVEAPDPDEIQSAYLEAVEKGAEAVVFYDPLPGRVRRFVVTGSWNYSLRGTAIAPVPALYVSREDGLRLAKCDGRKVTVAHRGRIAISTGYIVEAVVFEGEDEVLVTAHHDHWLTGVNDNLAGVALAILTAASLKSVDSGIGLRIASFTAEEFGDPSLPAWYWAYGSRWYVSALRGGGRLENIVAVLNYDIAATATPRVYASGLLFRRLVEMIARTIPVTVAGFDHSYTDSYSFSSQGVPAASIIDLEGFLDHYHSDLDDVGTLSVEGAWRSLQLYVKLGGLLLRRGHEALDYTGYGDVLYGTVIEAAAPVRVREEAYRLAELFDRLRGVDACADRVREAVRRLEARLVRAVFEGDYRASKGGFETLFMPELRLLRDAELVRRALDLARSGRWEEADRLLAMLPPSRVAVGFEEAVGSLGSHAMLEARVRGRVVEHLLNVLERAVGFAVARAAAEAANTIAGAVDELMAACASALGRGSGRRAP